MPKRRAGPQGGGRERRALGPRLGEPGRDDDDGLDALAAAVLDRLGHLGRGHHDHGQVDRALDVADRGHGRTPHTWSAAG